MIKKTVGSLFFFRDLIEKYSFWHHLKHFTLKKTPQDALLFPNFSSVLISFLFWFELISTAQPWWSHNTALFSNEDTIKWQFKQDYLWEKNKQTKQNKKFVGWLKMCFLLYLILFQVYSPLNRVTLYISFINMIIFVHCWVIHALCSLKITGCWVS